jgi:hypothetical protein
MVPAYSEEEMKNVASTIRKRIAQAGPDTIWTYVDFAFLPPFAVAAALSRLAKAGVLRRVRKGVYYAPKATRFGMTSPDPGKVAAAILDRHGVAWKATGLPMYNALGLTSQVSPVTTLAVDRDVRSLKLPPQIRIRRRAAGALKQATAEERAVLDALRELRSIPGSPPEEVLHRIAGLFKSNALSFTRVARFAKAEPPRVRALLGAIGAGLPAPQAALQSLRKSLNPMTRFRIGVGHALPAAEDWNIA